MKAAMVVEPGQTPVYGDFREPVAGPDQVVIKVHASSISQITRGRASGRHYSAKGALPMVPGIDGAGMTSDGKRVYFILPEAPFGGMAAHTLVDDHHLIALPDEVSFELAAAMAIPGMSSWAALTERAHLAVGETVLINGATGTSGRLAIQIARHLGAKKVIATGRREADFGLLHALGADVTIGLNQDGEALDRAFAAEFQEGVDVVLDYVFGVSAERLLAVGAETGPEGVAIRYVQIGSIGAASINLSGAALRSSALQMMGSGIGSVPFATLRQAIKGVFDATSTAGFQVATQTMALADVTAAWSAAEGAGRIVLCP